MSNSNKLSLVVTVIIGLYLVGECRQQPTTTGGGAMAPTTRLRLPVQEDRPTEQAAREYAAMVLRDSLFVGGLGSVELVQLEYVNGQHGTSRGGTPTYTMEVRVVGRVTKDCWQRIGTTEVHLLPDGFGSLDMFPRQGNYRMSYGGREPPQWELRQPGQIITYPRHWQLTWVKTDNGWVPEE